MTVEELIARLKQFAPDAQVYLNWSHGAEPGPVERVVERGTRDGSIAIYGERQEASYLPDADNSYGFYPAAKRLMSIYLTTGDEPVEQVNYDIGTLTLRNGGAPGCYHVRGSRRNMETGNLEGFLWIGIATNHEEATGEAVRKAKETSDEVYALETNRVIQS